MNSVGTKTTEMAGKLMVLKIKISKSQENIHSRNENTRFYCSLNMTVIKQNYELKNEEYDL
jgi:hypothetical protein